MSAHEPQPLVRTAFKLEREIQRRLEADLSEVFGIRIPLTVFPNGDTRPGRIDSMGIALAQLSPRPSLPLRRHAHSLGQNLARGPRGATPRDQRDVHDSLHAVKPVRRPAAVRGVRVTQEHLRASFHVDSGAFRKARSEDNSCTQSTWTRAMTLGSSRAQVATSH